MALAAASFEASPKSFSAHALCVGGVIGTGANPGNCDVTAPGQSVAGAPRMVISITIGATTYTFNGTVGVDIATLGTQDLATLNPAFLVELGAGNPISIAWRQLVSVTGTGWAIGTNMNCRTCTVYYAITSSASQNSTLTALFNATYTADVGLAEIPEPSTWLVMASGLALLGAARFRRR